MCIGLNCLFADLGNELFQYWVDRAHALKVRVPTAELMAQARTLLALGKATYERWKAADGRINHVHFPKAITYTWLARWRRQYGLTYRSVTLVYKVSKEVAQRRYGVLWSNCLRLRILHEKLFGPNLLRFVNVDEKPLWFNSLEGRKILTHRGKRQVECKGHQGKQHQRWTGMTVCASWDWPTDPRPMPLCWNRV